MLSHSYVVQCIHLRSIYYQEIIASKNKLGLIIHSSISILPNYISWYSNSKKLQKDAFKKRTEN